MNQSSESEYCAKVTLISEGRHSKEGLAEGHAGAYPEEQLE